MKRWPTKSLGELCDFSTGGTPKSTVREYYDGGSINWVVSGDVHKKQIWECDKKITELGLRNSSAKVLTKDSVLIALNGQGRTRGTVAILRVEATCNQSIVCMTPKDRHNLKVEYLFYCLEGLYQQIRDITGDNDRRGLNMPILRRITVPMAPIGDQERIVRLLDEADVLVKLRAKASGRMAALTPAVFHEMFGDPTYIEKMHWPFKSLGDFAKVSYGLADKLDAATKVADGTRILTISNVLLSGSLDTTVEKYSIVEPLERAKARLQKYDLLFNWRNGSENHVGKTAIWEEQVDGEVLHVSFLLKIRVDQTQVNPYFLWALINRLRATGYFTRNARMQINRKFNASELSALKLPVPPLPLQNEFAQRVAEIRAMEAEQTISGKHLDDLFQSMLHRAFEGEL